MSAPTPEARALYLRHGYAETHRISIGRYDLVYMVKPLGRPAPVQGAG